MSKLSNSFIRLASCRFFLTSVVLLTLMTSDTTSAQDDSAAVAAIEKAGGRVKKISAASEDREVSFYLSDKPITDEHLALVPKVSNVTWLNLANSRITDDGLKHIAGMKQLTKLHLEKTNVGDEGLKHLKKLNKLEYLNVYGTQVSDEGLEHLSELSNLRKLHVWQSKVSENGVKSLETILPKLKITGGVKFTPGEPVVDEKKKADDKTAEKKEAKKEGKASEKSLEKAAEKVEQAYKKFYDGMASDDLATRKAAFDELFIDLPTVKALFGKSEGEELWKLMSPKVTEMRENTAKIRSELIHDTDLISIEANDLRKEEYADEAFDIIPKNIPLFHVVIKSAKKASGSSVYVVVDGKVRFVKGLASLCRYVKSLRKK